LVETVKQSDSIVSSASTTAGSPRASRIGRSARVIGHTVTVVVRLRDERVVSGTVERRFAFDLFRIWLV
jgi:hypothetical protein